MLSAVCGYLTSSLNATNGCIGHIPKSSIYLSSTLKGLTPDGRYIHLIKNGRVTYHPGYYAIDGRLLQPHI